MMSMKLLEFVIPPHIYHGCSTWKTLWEEKFKGVENSTLGDFTAVNMKNVVVAMLENTERSRIAISTST